MKGKKGTLHECTHLNKWGHVYNAIFLLQVALKTSLGEHLEGLYFRILSFSSYHPFGPSSPSSHEMRYMPLLGH
jgi:hypothetical protein